MFHREEVERILKQAQLIDSQCELFGTSTHQYKLNPPINQTFVDEVEKKYNFQLPNDYVQFITEVGDGGAGPSYGIYQFGNFMRKGKTPRIEKSYEAYRYSLGRPFTPQPIPLNEAEWLAECFGFDIEAYKENPKKYFAYENDNDLCAMDGFLVLGSHGCGLEYGLITSGERYGQVFDTDNEGIYMFIAYSFTDFYQNWLDRLSDVEHFRKELEKWRK